RRAHHPLGDPALQRVPRRCHPRSREDVRGKVPVLMPRHALLRRSTTQIPDQRAGQPLGTGWKETYRGGSPEAERTEFLDLAVAIMSAPAIAQKQASAHGGPHAPARTLHVKATLALREAELRFRDDLAADLRHGFAQPGASYRTTVRFSNAANV